MPMAVALSASVSAIGGACAPLYPHYQSPMTVELPLLLLGTIIAVVPLYCAACGTCHPGTQRGKETLE